MSQTGIVYIATSPSGKSYVGMTTTGLPTRKRKHARKAQKTADNTPFLNALRKYGDEIRWDTLISGVPVRLLGAVERRAIEVYNVVAAGYNVREGGTGGGGLSADTAARERQIAALVRSNRARAGKGTRGPLSAEHKQLILKNRAWYFDDPEYRKRVSERTKQLRATRFWSSGRKKVA